MSKDTYEIIIAKLAKLDEYLTYLKSLQKKERKEFIDNFEIHGLAERYLHLAIEVILDVGKLLTIEKNLSRPENNYEIFEILHKNKIISDELFNSLNRIAGFRNILVHDYMKIDTEIVYQHLQSRLDDFEEFKKAVVQELKLD